MIFERSVFRQNVLVFVPSLFFVSMLLPSFHAVFRGEDVAARTFFYGCILGVVALVILFFALSHQKSNLTGARAIAALVAFYFIFPVFLAFPLHEVLQGARFIDAYLEMLSALTTTGLPVIDSEKMTRTLALWRALVAWYGAGIIWCAVLTVLRPIHTAGISRQYMRVSHARVKSGGFTRTDFDRFESELKVFAPVYFMLTLILAFLYWVGGAQSVDAIIGAFQVLSTTGFAQPHFANTLSDQFAFEWMTAIFLIFALCRRNLTFLYQSSTRHVLNLRTDENIFAMRLIVVLVSIFMLVYFIDLYDGNKPLFTFEAFSVFWGAAYTFLSFLTTYGVPSGSFYGNGVGEQTNTGAVILIGLAIIGGGVATTAGGIKLYRILSVLRYSAHDLKKLIAPHEMQPKMPAQVAQDGKEIAITSWVYFMIFTFILALSITLFTLMGFSFETGLLLALSGLSNTGGVVQLLNEFATDLLLLPDIGKAVLALNMVLGRVEILAVISLFTSRL